MNNVFPRCPVAGTARLVPITSWLKMRAERKATGVEYDLFWDESVAERVAYFFSWRGRPRATVLVVWQDRKVTHVECRKIGDEEMSAADSRPVITEVVRTFSAAGFDPGKYAQVRHHGRGKAAPKKLA